MAFPAPYPPMHWPLSTHEIEGLEFDWFAQDKVGQLAVFTTAGRGFVPHLVFSGSVVSYNDFIATIAGRTTAPGILEHTGDGCYHDWREFAEHGLFGYDFQDVHRVSAMERGGYDLIYRPSVPATIEDLPEHVFQYLPILDTVFGRSDLIPLSLIQKLD